MVFQSPEWVSAIHQFLSGQHRLELWTVHDHRGTARATVPMWSTDLAMCFAGSPLNDHNGVIVGSGADETHAVALLVAKWIATGRSVQLGELADGAQWEVGDPRMTVAATHGEVSPLLVMRGTWDDYSRTVSKRLRYDRERALRRAASLGATFEVVAESEHVGEAVTMMLRRRRDAWRSRGRYEELPSIERHPDHPVAISSGARGLARSGRAIVVRLAADGQPLAEDLWIRRGGTWHLYTRHYEEGYRSLGPGGALLWYTLRHFRNLGCYRFDFGRGGESYKYRLGAAAVVLHEVALHDALIDRRRG